MLEKGSNMLINISTQAFMCSWHLYTNLILREKREHSLILISLYCIEGLWRTSHASITENIYLNDGKSRGKNGERFAVVSKGVFDCLNLP